MKTWYWSLILFFLLFGFSSRAQSDIASYLPDGFDQYPYAEKYHILDSIRLYGDPPYHINIGLALLGIKLGEEKDRKADMAHWAVHVARFYGNQGLYQEAHDYALQGLEYAREVKHLDLEVQALVRIARSQIDLQNYREALNFAKQAEEQAQFLPDSNRTSLAWAINMEGEIHRFAGDFQKALDAYEDARVEFEQQGFNPGREAAVHNKGLALIGLEAFDEASKLLNQEMQSYYAHDPVRILEYQLGMTEIFGSTQRMKEAVQMANAGLDFADSTDNQRFQINFYDQLADLERIQGRWEDAWEYREKAIRISEEILSEQVRRQSKVLDVRFELDQLEAENNLLLEKSRGQNLYTNALIAITLLVLIIACILIFSFSKTRRYNRELARRNTQLDGFIQEKDILMNIMAHDLKAPLHAVGGMMELITDPETPDQMRQRCADKIEVALNRGTNLISNILQMAALESGEIGVNMQETDLSDVLAGILEENAPQAHQKRIDLHLETAQSIQVKTDPILVERIVNNFLSNAIKYSPEGKTVQVNLLEQGSAVMIEVQDEGPGLSKKDQEQLFQKFKTLSAKPTGGESATGLGLALAWALAGKIKGEIVVKSTLGQGATFSLCLPKTA